MQMLPLPPWVGSVAAVVAFQALVALIPLRFRVRLEWRGAEAHRRAGFELSVLGGLAVYRLVVPVFRIGRSGGSPGLVTLLGRAVNTGYRATRGEAKRQKARRVLTVDKVRQGARAVLIAGGPVAQFVAHLVLRTYWRRVTWTTTVGVGDAAHTAVLAGVLWGVKAGLVGAARQTLRLAPGQPEYRVVPVFSGEATTSVLDGQGTVRVGHVQLALVMLLAGVGRAWLERSRGRRAGREHHPGVPA